MRPVNKAVLAAFVVGTGAGFAAGCQVYDFEPVVPLTIEQYTTEVEVVARSLKPNLMLLVDKSGSMDLPADRTDPDCTVDAGVFCGEPSAPDCVTSGPNACATRWSELQGAMGEFLTNNGTVARMGLAVYPTNLRCGITGEEAQIRTPLNQSEDSDTAGLEATAADINGVLQGITTGGAGPNGTGGGTPTGLSVEILSTLPELNASDEREDYLLVLTDGLPNCNPDHPTPFPNCFCTGNCDPAFGTEATGCLDDVATVAAVASAREAGIKTIVVGFGDETAGEAGEGVLNAMAEAGGFVRTCPDGGGCECSFATDPPTCTDIKYFQAANRAQLSEALANIAGTINPDACLFQLPPGSEPPDDDPRFIVLYLTPAGEETQRLTAGPDTFTYTPGSPALVELVGSTCALVENATPANPVNVQIKIISTL